VNASSTHYPNGQMTPSPVPWNVTIHLLLVNGLFCKLGDHGKWFRQKYTYS
jgi:hypothetical protein